MLGMTTQPTTRLERFESHTQRPLTALAVAFLVVYAIPILRPGADATLLTACAAASWGIWAAFALDYLIRLALAQERLAFIRGHLLELIAVALPMLRPLRALRVLSLANLAARMDEEGGLFESVAQAVAAAVALVVLVSSLAILDAERGADNASIATFGDAIWWAIATITTVGYGDLYPVTTAGRAVASFLMLTGIALIGVVTASIATWATTYLVRSRPGAETSTSEA